MTTELNRLRRIALLQWHAACEKLTTAIAPQAGVEPPTDQTVAEAIEDTHQALDELAAAYRNSHGSL